MSSLFSNMSSLINSAFLGKNKLSKFLVVLKACSKMKLSTSSYDETRKVEQGLFLFFFIPECFDAIFYVVGNLCESVRRRSLKSQRPVSLLISIESESLPRPGRTSTCES
jgi:hypothetical protein